MVIRLHYPTKLIEISFKAGELYTPSNDLSEAGANHNPLRLTDEELALMKPLLPPQRPNKASHPSRRHRQLLHGIFCILGTDALGLTCQNAMLPARPSPIDSLRGKGRLVTKVAGGFASPRPPYGSDRFTFAALDSRLVRAHKAAGAKKRDWHLAEW